MGKAETLARYREENRSAQKGQILFVGSSLMEQFPVAKLLQERGVNCTVYNRGISGYVTAELMENLDVCVTDLMPRRLFINIGTNDLSDSSVTPEILLQRYEQIISSIEQKIPGVEILMMAYYPVNIDAASESIRPALLVRTNEKIRAANRLVEQMALRRGHRYIDVNRALTDEQGRLKAEYTTEGMHIREEGYRAIMDDLIPFVTGV